MQAQQQLEQYHLLWRENENRLNHLALLKAVAETGTHDPRLLPETGAVFAASQTSSRGCTGTLSASAVSHAQHLSPRLEDPALPLILTDRKSRAEAEYRRYLDQIGPLLQKNRLYMESLEDAVRKVSDAMLREVLRMRYFDGGFCRLTPWRLVALRLYGDDDSAALQYICRLHREALAAVTPFLPPPIINTPEQASSGSSSKEDQHLIC